MSLSAFLRLLRDRLPSGPGDPKPPSNALRHELSALNRMIAEFDLPILVERRGAGVRARIDHARLRTNIDQAKRLFTSARTSFMAADFGHAVGYVARALEVDYDCVAAVTLLARVRQVSGCHLTTDAVARAEICTARAMIRSTAALQRLERLGTAGGFWAVQARETATRMLVRLQRQWCVFGSWDVEMSPTEVCDPGDRTAIRNFLELVVDARRGDRPDVYERFASSAITGGVVNRLLKGRVSDGNPLGRKEAAAYLTVEVFARLVLNGWLPAPAMSKPEFMEQLVRHLMERRIDWGKVLNRSPGRTAEFRVQPYEACRPRSRRINDDDDENDLGRDGTEEDE